MSHPPAIRLDVFGWFDGTAAKPTHDPGVDGGKCPLCGLFLSRPTRTVSLMPLGSSNRSYFFRMHRSCSDAATPADMTAVESSLIDRIVDPQQRSRAEG